MEVAANTVCIQESQLEKPANPQRVLVVFNSLALYGMERAVIETFDVLRPDVKVHFLIARASQRYDTRVWSEVQARTIDYSLFSDYQDWPRIGKPRSLVQFWRIISSVIRANLDVFRRSLDNDVLYLPNVTCVFYSALAALYYRISGKKSVYAFHDLATLPSRRLRLASLFMTDLIHNTHRSYALVTRANPYLLKKANYIIPPRVEIRSRTGWEDTGWRNKRNILFIGQISPHKGFDLLIESFIGLAKQYDDVVLHIAGELFDDKFRYLTELAGPDAPIKYWGYVQNIHDLLKVTYVYVHPSPPSVCQESFGRGVVEAMAVGVPVVCFRSGALEEIVEDGVTGLICEHETAASLTRNLQRFLDNPQLRNACGRNARNRYDSRYSESSIRQAWMKLLEPA